MESDDAFSGMLDRCVAERTANRGNDCDFASKVDSCAGTPFDIFDNLDDSDADRDSCDGGSLAGITGWPVTSDVDRIVACFDAG